MLPVREAANVPALLQPELSTEKAVPVTVPEPVRSITVQLWEEFQKELAAAGEPITEKSLDRAMALAHSPDPDLLIRTGGEFRISNFLLWQVAYSELVFSDKLWPEFDEAALDKAIAVYNGRERRFGKTSAQVAAATFT